MAWPIVLTGNYIGGSVCDASEYSTDLTAIVNGLNELYERFSSYPVTGTWQERVDAADTTTGFRGSGALDERYMLSVLQVPTWMQGLRIRELRVSNHSQVSVVGGTTLAAGAWRLGVSYAPTLADLDIVAATYTAGNAVDVGTVDFDSIGEILGYGAIGAAVQNTAPVVRASTGLNRVVPPGEFVAIWGAGIATLSAGAAAGSYIAMSARVLCDVMVPVP